MAGARHKRIDNHLIRQILAKTETPVTHRQSVELKGGHFFDIELTLT